MAQVSNVGDRPESRGWRPILFLDVDGVLNTPPPARAGQCLHVLPDGRRVILNDEHGAWLRDLALACDLVWATSWAARAATHLGQRLGLPPMPLVESPHARSDADLAATGVSRAEILRELLAGHDTWKLPGDIAYAGDRPCIWIDDQLRRDALDWATSRPVPALLITPDPAIGLTWAHVEQAAEFMRQIGLQANPEGRG